MSDQREAFEAVFPPTRVIEWREDFQRYAPMPGQEDNGIAIDRADVQQERWIGYQAGQAAQAQGAAPVGQVTSPGVALVTSKVEQGTKLYTAPQPAKPAVPEGHMLVPKGLVERWASVDAFNAPRGAAMEIKTIAEYMLATPQPPTD